MLVNTNVKNPQQISANVYLFLCVYVHITVCVQVCEYAHKPQWVCRGQRTIMDVSPHLLLVWDRGLLAHLSVCLAGWLASFQGFSCLVSHLAIGRLGLKTCFPWVLGIWTHVLTLVFYLLEDPQPKHQQTWLSKYFTTNKWDLSQQCKIFLMPEH